MSLEISAKSRIHNGPMCRCLRVRISLLWESRERQGARHRLGASARSPTTPDGAGIMIMHHPHLAVRRQAPPCRVMGEGDQPPRQRLARHDLAHSFPINGSGEQPGPLPRLRGPRPGRQRVRPHGDRIIRRSILSPRLTFRLPCALAPMPTRTISSTDGWPSSSTPVVRRRSIVVLYSSRSIVVGAEDEQHIWLELSDLAARLIDGVRVALVPAVLAVAFLLRCDTPQPACPAQPSDRMGPGISID